MNLVQLANDLEYVPRKELAEMSQDPNSSYPAYLVLSEIQRRTLNDKNFAAMQERPTTTVAEEVVDEFMQPQLAQNQSQGLQGGTPQSATPLPDSNISAGLSGVPTAPMQMAAIGGLTGYANKGVTESLPAGSAPQYSFPTDMPQRDLAKTLGVDMYNPDGTLKDKDILDQELRTRFDVYNQPAVDNTSDLPSATAPAPAPAPVVTPTPAPTPAPAPFNGVQPPPASTQADLALLQQAQALGIDISGIFNADDLKTKIAIEQSMIKPDANVSTNKSKDRIDQTLDLAKQLSSELDPNFDVKFKPTEIDSVFTKPINRQTLTPRNYNAPTEEDRQRELDVMALAGLAGAVGGAKNLAELGVNVGKTGMGISQLKRDQRKDMNAIEALRRDDQIQSIALDQSYNKEERDIAKVVTDINIANNSGESNVQLQLAQIKAQYGAKNYTIAQSIIRDQVLQEQIDATGNKNLLDAYSALQVDQAKLNFFDPATDLDANGKAQTPVGEQWMAIDAQKQVLLREWFKLRGLPMPQYQGQ
jgi:hypothetical protein